jgi:NUMOD4 motif-containing protein
LCDGAEQWRPTRRYAGFYEVSCCGNVYSMPRAATAGGLLAVQVNSRGYRVVLLSKYGRVRTVMVARLVLEAFAEPGQGRRARHGPGGKLDDSLPNLSWAL